MEPKQDNSFLASAILYGFVFGIISSVISLFTGYQTISSEPSGVIMTPLMYGGIVICLVTIFAGLLAVKHHVGIYNAPVKLGRGAVIGLTTGIFIALFSTLIGLLWMVIDPAYLDKMMEVSVRNLEGIPNIPQESIDSTVQQFERMKTLWGQLRTFAFSALFSGGLNAISGIVGVKLFSPKDESSDFS